MCCCNSIKGGTWSGSLPPKYHYLNILHSAPIKFNPHHSWLGFTEQLKLALFRGRTSLVRNDGLLSFFQWCGDGDFCVWWVCRGGACSSRNIIAIIKNQVNILKWKFDCNPLLIIDRLKTLRKSITTMQREGQAPPLQKAMVIMRMRNKQYVY